MKVEVVGSVDSGIKAACWSPDDEQLVLITGKLCGQLRGMEVIISLHERGGQFGLHD